LSRLRSLAARAQQAGIPVIGFLDPRSPDVISERLRDFRRGLKETGYVEGENVAIEYCWAEGQYDLLPALAAELVRRQVAARPASSTPNSTLVRRRSRRSKPRVMASSFAGPSWPQKAEGNRATLRLSG
jgi:putative ABC transport system substrate-binding protein